MINLAVIIQMHQGERMRRKRGQKDVALATLTSNISHILNTLHPTNHTHQWKNSSAKIPTQKTATIQPNHKALMTEDDIDRLFSSNSKSKNHSVVSPKANGTVKPKVGGEKLTLKGGKKDFASSCRFLQVDEVEDRLLSGLVEIGRSGSREVVVCGDLTAEFKRQYTVGKVIGEGAYASVRIAVHKSNNRKVAIKIYQKARIQDIQRKKSVRREIRILQAVSHPNIMSILDVVETNNHLNIIMEYLDGISLGSFLRAQKNQRATQSQAKVIIRGLAQALEYLHQRQISHRDMKLQNIILGESLTPKIIDFGFSTSIESSRKVKLFCGTPSYMAPQIVQKREYRGQTADVWALGVLTFIALTGIFPFKGATDQQLYHKINYADYPKHELYFSKEAADIVGKMLTVNPEHRITAAGILTHSWLTPTKTAPRKERRTTELSQVLKRPGVSSHKSKQREQLNATTKARRVTEMGQQNKYVRQSPGRLNATLGQGRGVAGRVGGGGGSYKVLELLKMGLRQDQKSRNKTRRI